MEELVVMVGHLHHKLQRDGGRGTAGTGSGGGGGGGTSPYGPNAVSGGSGGSGLVVVRYQIATIQTDTAKATGGAISYFGGKTIHTFTNTGTFTAPSPLNPSPLSVECFIVGGGGGGGAGIGGGGGAGGVVYSSGIPITLGSPYAINVGAGGGGSVVPAGSTLGTGSDTTALGLTAKGGGGGGNGQGGTQAGAAGGSSGGTGSTTGSDPAAASQPGTSNPGAPINVGNVGGPGSSTTNKGGGGGAGGAATGEPMPSTGAAGTGGLAIQAPPAFRDPAQRSGPTPNPYDGGGLGYPGPGSSFHWFAGGGGGGAYNPAPATGGAGGGGTFPALMVVLVKVEMMIQLEILQEKTLVPVVEVEVIHPVEELVVMVVPGSFSSHIPPNK